MTQLADLAPVVVTVHDDVPETPALDAAELVLFASATHLANAGEALDLPHDKLRIVANLRDVGEGLAS